MVGCPIRISTDQFVCANPRSFSQLITSFFVSESLGIPHTPLISLSPFCNLIIHKYCDSNLKYSLKLKLQQKSSLTSYFIILKLFVPILSKLNTNKITFYLSYIFYDIIISQYVNELVTNTLNLYSDVKSKSHYISINLFVPNCGE